MRKEYWIKKDPMKDSQDNWIKMNGFEFSRFKETEDGKKREKNVARVPGGEPYEFLYMEVDPETAKQWKSETNGEYYQNQVKEELGITVVSYHGIETEDEELTGEDMIADPDCDVEGDVLLKIQKEELRRACLKLKRKEMALIDAMYLSEDPMSEEAYSLVIGTSRQYVHKLKQQILQKLKFLMES